MTRTRAAVLLTTMGLLAVAVCVEAGRGRKEAISAAAGPSSASDLRHVVIYYFHRTVRCPSCERIEEWTEAALRPSFAAALETGALEWRTVNLDEPANMHFERDYDLAMQSVVISEVRGGKEVRWKNLERVWDMLDDEPGFTRYVQDEIRIYEQGT